eukprot:857284-Alexandrium_andersonii.AAC.1
MPDFPSSAKESVPAGPAGHQRQRLARRHARAGLEGREACRLPEEARLSCPSGPVPSLDIAVGRCPRVD